MHYRRDGTVPYDIIIIITRHLREGRASCGFALNEDREEETMDGMYR